jgi:hypothetical protein
VLSVVMQELPEQHPVQFALLQPAPPVHAPVTAQVPPVAAQLTQAEPAPAEPQAVSLSGETQVLPTQQPVQLWALQPPWVLASHAPAPQTGVAPEHTAQLPPTVPQALALVPSWQARCESQHPRQLEGPHGADPEHPASNALNEEISRNSDKRTSCTA